MLFAFRPAVESQAADGKVTVAVASWVAIHNASGNLTRCGGRLNVNQSTTRGLERVRVDLYGEQDDYRRYDE